jgi:trimeric autotransporter adhesin
MRKILRGHVFNIRFLFTLCLGFACSAIHAQVSGTFTINSAVATGSGNFQTFSAAAASLAGGVNGPVIFNVQAGSGPYNEQMVLNNITGTSATNTITFNCNGVTLTFLSTNSLSRAGVKLNNTDYVTIDNLVVTPQGMNPGEYGYGFHLLNDADNNTIKNCHIINNLNFANPETTEGIVINGNDQNPMDPGYSNCDFNLIQQNLIEGSGIGITLSSIPVSGNPAKYMDNNKLVKNTINNWFKNGIEVYYSSNTQVDGNDFVAGWENYWSTGIYLGELNQKVAVINNRIHDMIIDPGYSGNLTYGIMVNTSSVAGQENLIANNAMYNWSSNGTQYGIFSQGGSYFNIYNNTISLDDQVLKGDTAHAVELISISNVNFKNNIVTITRPVTFENYGLFLTNATSTFNSDHNVFYVPGSPSTCHLGFYVGNPIDNLASWQTNTGYDRFSAQVNPSFVNSAAGNLAPTAQYIDNMALYVNLNTDINAAARNTQAPDPGCWEFTSAACTTPVTTGSIIISPDSNICLGPKVSLSLTGNSAGNGQTYTWQTSSTLTGTYTNLSSALVHPYYETAPNTPLYYRAAVTCGASTVYSSPIRVLVTNPLNGGTYTINNALPTGGVNFNSFSDAVRALQCGINGSIVFNVASGSGPYVEQMIIPVISTAANRTVTFNGNGATISYATSAAPKKTSVIKLDGADYITIDSLNVAVQGTASGFGFGILLTNDADNNTIKRCTINVNTTSTSSNYGGIIMSAREDDPINEIFPSNCDNNLIASNKVNGGYYGINCVSQTNLALAPSSFGNVIRNNTITDICGVAMYIAGTGSVLIDSNDISHPTRTVFSAAPFEGIHVSKLNYGLNITQNRIHDLLSKVRTAVIQVSGIQCVQAQGTAAQPNVVSNNLIYNFSGYGLQEGLYTFSSNYLKFYHNSISLEDTAAGAVTKETRGFGLFGSTTTGVEFKNNCIVIRRGGAKEKYCINVGVADSNLVSNYNSYYIHAAYGTDNNIGYMGGITYPTMASWLATRKDSSSINLDPVYNDLAKGDLMPTRILFENRGTNVGITVDQLNNTRSTTKPDIGAIEFTICSPLAKPKVTVEDAETNIIKFAWNAIPNTTGYRVSRDNLNWTIPSSGAMGLNHTVTGLKPTDKITLWVKALGTRVDCPEYLSDSTEGQALTDGVFVPNTFTPNGDTHNDYFKVYSNVTKTIHWMVFSQWGEKIFEANDIQAQWDGTYKGKPQPVGVYVYVVSGMLTDGTKVSQKGTFNLVR